MNLILLLGADDIIIKFPHFYLLKNCTFRDVLDILSLFLYDKYSIINMG